MSTAASHYWARERSRAPRLRLLRGAESVRAGSPRADESTRSVAGRPALRLMVDPAPVLIAGSDSARRAALIDDLTQTMPQSTLFEEASAVSEVLEQAPASRMVILSGDLDDTPAESLMHMLGHRHPGLPVVSVEGPAPASRA
ncbi:MAG TPA: hypothetical protein VK272_07235 [Solirubrobacteraceae bacterium]|nr:hypothetical protein [Solirubrobacteraceae bacterium]HLM85963.1 hypothetical protein [Solirubrobacteraceae bacterium]